MTATGIPAAGPGGVLRLTWVRDRLTHVLEHCEVDEPSGTWTGQACPDHGLALGSDALTGWAAEHGQLFPAVFQVYYVGQAKAAAQLWAQAVAPGLGGEPYLAGADPTRWPDQVLPGQAAALGGSLLRASLRPARPPKPACPQHRLFGPNEPSLSR
jgi:hypothetical protein